MAELNATVNWLKRSGRAERLAKKSDDDLFTEGRCFGGGGIAASFQPLAKADC